jgi:DNA-directed RNA polymerase subunit E'/Rpb7
MDKRANRNLYVDLVIRENMMLKPAQLGKNFRAVIADKLDMENAGKCNRHGYILPNTIKLLRVTPGEIDSPSLNGDINFELDYIATVCNPANGMTIRAVVMNTNTFGVMAHCRIDTTSAVLEIVIPKRQQLAMSVNRTLPSLDNIGVGTVVDVELVDKQFSLHHSNIECLGVITRVHRDAKTLDDVIDTEESNEVVVADADADAGATETDDATGTEDGLTDDDVNDDDGSTTESDELSRHGDDDGDSHAVASVAGSSAGDEASVYGSIDGDADDVSTDITKPNKESRAVGGGGGGGHTDSDDDGEYDGDDGDGDGDDTQSISGGSISDGADE